MRKSTSKGGVALVAWQNGSGVAPQPCFPRRSRARIAPRAGGSRRDGDAGRWRAVSRSADGRDRREGPVRPRHGGGRGPEAAHRAAVRRCCMFPPLLHPVRLAVPDPVGRCARECSNFPPLPVRIRDCRAVEEVALDVTPVFGDRVYSTAITTTYEGSAAVLRAACRSEDRRSQPCAPSGAQR